MAISGKDGAAARAFVYDCARAAMKEMAGEYYYFKARHHQLENLELRDQMWHLEEENKTLREATTDDTVKAVLAESAKLQERVKYLQGEVERLERTLNAERSK